MSHFRLNSNTVLTFPVKEGTIFSNILVSANLKIFSFILHAQQSYRGIYNEIYDKLSKNQL